MISKLAVVAAVVAFVLAAGAIYQAIGMRRSARRHAPPGELIEAAGQQLHVSRAGTGRPAVLFEAGVAASSLSWTRVLPAGAGFKHACAHDRAGLGWSARSRAPRTVDRIAAELGGVVAHASPAEPVVLVGHSFGAF